MFKEYFIGKLGGGSLGALFALLIIPPTNSKEFVYRFLSGIISSFTLTKSAINYFGINYMNQDGSIDVDIILAVAFSISLAAWYVGGIVMNTLSFFRKNPKIINEIIVKVINKKIK